MRRGWIVGTVLLCGFTAACGSPVSPATGTSSAAATPSGMPPVSQPTPTPARAPTAAEDAADLKRALLTTKDLGGPWTQPKAVTTVQSKKGEICPGHLSATRTVKVTARTRVDLTEGKGAGKNIGSFSLRMLPTESGKAMAAAYAKDQKACAGYRDANGLFVTRSLEGPTSVDGAEVLSAWAERVYVDQAHTDLAYARHSVVTQQGRAVTVVSYAFLVPKTDPEAKDFTPVTRLLTAQLKKTAKVLG